MVSRKKLIFFICAAWFACTAATGWMVWKSPPGVQDLDEAAWIFSGYYYRLAFEKHDFSSPDWKSRDALDHPPLAKFLYGAVGEAPPSLERKNFWLEHAFDLYEQPELVRKLNAIIPPETLRAGRALNASLTCLAELAFLILVGVAFGPAAAAAFACTWAASALVWVYCAQIGTESLFLLILSLIIALDFFRIRGKRNEIALTCAIGACIGLLSDVKIAGIAALPISLTSLFLFKRDRRVALSCVGMIVSCISVAIAANPSLYSSPLSFALKMLEYRSQTLHFQQVAFANLAFANPALQALGFLNGLLLSHDPCYQVTGIPVFLALVVFGMMSASVKRTGSSEARALLLHLGAWAILSALFYRLAFDRYLLYALPFAALIAAIGLSSLRTLTPKRGIAVTATTAVLTLLFSNAKVSRFFAPDATTVRESRSRQIDYLLSRHPGNEELMKIRQSLIDAPAGKSR